MLTCYIRHRMADNKIDDIKQLMDLSGVSRNSITKLYRDNNIETTKIETLTRLCDTFNCKLSDLIEYVPDDK